MRRIKIIAGLIVFAFLVVVTWQVVAAYVANIELREDLRDMASQASLRIGLADPSSSEDFRKAVIHKAESYDIHLDPGQVTVQITGAGISASVYLAADYQAPINLYAFSFSLHFNPNSKR